MELGGGEDPDMEAERWRRLQELFHAAAEQPPATRRRFLEAHCDGDRDLLESALKLLAAGEKDDRAVRGAVVSSLKEAGTLWSSPARLGPYRVLRELGRGGLGTVFLAERDDEHYTKEVAVKLVRFGLRGPEALERLRQERQILARLEHPNVARLLDGGATEEGLPYFVMEYVRGEPVDLYCDRRRLSLVRRIELFREVCSAVQAAHRNLILHRDVKPANVLVSENGVPKLLDFGIAKSLAPESASEALVQTATGESPRTLAYASPEQVRSEPLTTATDVYSLGILLYRLLTGHHPYPLTPRLSELERAICEVEPRKASEVVLEDAVSTPAGNAAKAYADSAELAALRGTTPEALRRRLSGDLDTILATALRKEPARRYNSVEQLSYDLRRFLESRPVTARPDTFGYRTARFLRRHRQGVLAAGLSTALLAAGVVGILKQTLVARSERARAEQLLTLSESQRLRAERLSDFLFNLVRIPDPSESRGNTVTVREVVERNMEELARHEAESLDKAFLLSTAARVFQNLGVYSRAEPLLREALRLLLRTHGDAHQDVATTRNQLGELDYVLGRYGAAEEQFREALRVRRQLLGEDHSATAETFVNLAVIHHTRGELDMAEPLYRQSLRIWRRAGERREEVKGLSNLATLHFQKGDADTAETLLREVLDVQRELLGTHHPDVASTVQNLATVLQARGEKEEAGELLEEALALQRNILGEEHPDIARTLNELGALKYSLDRFDEAESLYLESLTMKERLLGPGHRSVALTWINLGDLQDATHRPEKAAESYARALTIRREQLGEQHELTLEARERLARARR